MIDPKIKAVLEARGLWNHDGINRKAHGRLCHRCGSPTMVGLDADRCALAAVCNPQPLTVLGELQALLSGLRTFTLTWLGGRYEIDYRDQWRIKGSPPGSEANTDVLAEHKCGIEYGQQFTTDSKAIRTKKGVEFPDEPNY